MSRTEEPVPAWATLLLVAVIWCIVIVGATMLVKWAKPDAEFIKTRPHPDIIGYIYQEIC